MKRIPMIAIADFEHEGVVYTEGKRIEVRPIEAAALKYQRRARFVTADDPVFDAADDVPAEAPPTPLVESKALDTRPRRKPRKKRRDIVRPQYTKASPE